MARPTSPESFSLAPTPESAPPLRGPSDEQAVALLLDLVATPSVSKQEAACAALLVEWMSRMGYRAFIDAAGSAVGEIGSTAADAREIILLGHIDTVPGDIAVRVVEGKLFGRGSVDAKGSLAAFAIASARARLPDGVRVRVIGAVEEECATSAGARLAAREYRPAACIIGEPSGCDGVTLGYKGRLLADLQISTPNTHSAGPEKTAAELGVEAWVAVEAAARGARPGAARVFDQLQAKLRSIGCSDDGLIGTAELRIGFRLPPGMLHGEIEALCHAATHGLDAPHTWTFSAPEIAHIADRNNAVVRCLSNSIRERGGTPRMKVKTGTADMNVVGGIWNCPIAAYGPGDSALDHTPHEHIEIGEYLASIGVLTGALEALGGQVAGGAGG